MNTSAIGANVLFTGAYGLAYVTLVVFHVIAWGRAPKHRGGGRLLILSMVLWVASFAAEMTVFGIFSAIFLIGALITAIWGVSTMQSQSKSG